VLFRSKDTSAGSGTSSVTVALPNGLTPGYANGQLDGTWIKVANPQIMGRAYIYLSALSFRYNGSLLTGADIPANITFEYSFRIQVSQFNVI
jgi:hypothetical protein